MQVQLPGGKAAEIPDDWTPEQRAQAIRNYVNGPEFDKTIDKTSGAPATVRLQVGSAPDKDRLANLQRFYPDAIPYGDDNFVFVDPKTNRPTLYNPKGLDFGDVASVAKEGTQIVGSTLGATAGAIAGAGAGLLGGPAAPATVPGGAVTGAAMGAGAGNAVAGTLFDIAANTIGGRIDTRNAPERLNDTALDFAGGAVGQRAGDLLASGAKAVVGAGREGAGQLYKDFVAAGVDQPPAGAVSGSRPVQAMEKALENAPGSASRMQGVAERVVDQVRTEADRVANEFGTPRTVQGAGETVKDAAKGAIDRFNARQDEIYNAAFDLVGADTPVPVSSVTKLRQSLEAKLAQAPQSQKGTLGPAIEKLKEIEADAAGSGVPFEALRAIRTAIGEDIKSPLLAGQKSSQNTAMRTVYAALTDDMSAAAKSAGPDAERALAVADRYNRLQMTQNIPLLKKIVETDADEKAFQYAVGQAKEGGTLLAKLRKNFKPEEWDTVAATVVERLGLAKPGAQDAAGEAFSVNTFLTNWNRLSPEAKQALFGGSRYADAVPQLDRLSRVVGALKDTEKMANPSGTARHLANLGVVGVLGGALGFAYGGDLQTAATGLAGAVVAPNVAARLITSPKFVQWLVDAGRVATNPNGLAQHMSRLTSIAAAEPQIRQEIGQYISALRAAPAPQPR